MTSTPPKKNLKARLDDELVRRGIADSKKTAQAMIMAGDVIVDDQRVDKPSAMIRQDAVLRMREETQYVSRGGDKLFAAIQDLKLEQAFGDKIILDVGASTGGFTDCCLQLGAARAVAIDVGTNQLAWKLRTDHRVTSIEKTDIREYQPEKDLAFDWVVADISFNSLARLTEAIVKIAPTARLLLLIKPQFELPRDRIPSGGIVEAEEDRQDALDLATQALLKCGKIIDAQIDARVAGRSGNREIFILAH